MIVYKALKPGNRSQYQGYYWSTPHEGQPGEWVEAQDSGPLALCQNGIHGYMTEEIAGGQGPGCPYVYEMELEAGEGEEILQDDEKACGRRGRLLRLVRDRNGPVIQPGELVWQ